MSAAETPHDVLAEPFANGETLHRCVACGAETWNEAPELPCPRTRIEETA